VAPSTATEGSEVWSASRDPSVSHCVFERSSKSARTLDTLPFEWGGNTRDNISNVSQRAVTIVTFPSACACVEMWTCRAQDLSVAEKVEARQPPDGSACARSGASRALPDRRNGRSPGPGDLRGTTVVFAHRHGHDHWNWKTASTSSIPIEAGSRNPQAWTSFADTILAHLWPPDGAMR